MDNRYDPAIDSIYDELNALEAVQRDGLISSIDRIMPQLRAVQNAANIHDVSQHHATLTSVRAILGRGSTSIEVARGIVYCAYNYLCEQAGTTK